eukprot:9503033-Pyramimonas_sp.AAC.1
MNAECVESIRNWLVNVHSYAFGSLDVGVHGRAAQVTDHLQIIAKLHGSLTASIPILKDWSSTVEKKDLFMSLGADAVSRVQADSTMD